MSQKSISRQSSIIIVGAGVFRLSTALHLLDHGYQNVTIFDSQDFHKSEYSPLKGADSPSSDASKVVRSAYGASMLHQTLANQAISVWKSWNNSSPIPLFINCGWARLSDTTDLADDSWETATQKSMAASGLAHTQYNLANATDRARAEVDGWGGRRMDHFHRHEHGLTVAGFLDSLAGVAYADIACKFVLELVEKKGGKTIFGEMSGDFEEFLIKRNDIVETGDILSNIRRVIGIRTRDGESHLADLVIVAAGPHTPRLLPDLKRLITITPTSIFHLDVPEHLRERYRPEVWPTWVWNNVVQNKTRTIGGFPIDRHGKLKLLYDGTSWINLADVQYEPGAISGMPISASVVEQHRAPGAIPPEIRQFISEFIPELEGAEVSARLCWYTDTFDGNFIIDKVPQLDGCIVATGGSRHGFKFLPVLGEYVIDVIENRQNEFTQLWRWRKPIDESILQNEYLPGV